MTLISTIVLVCDQIKNDRAVEDVFMHTMTESGELAQEIIIEQGKSYKQPGKDGVVGEAMDMIICLVDLIRQHSPHLTEIDLINIASPKLQKWIDTAQ